MSRRIESITPLQRIWWRVSLALAAVCWIVVAALVQVGQLDSGPSVWTARHVVFHALLICAGLLTFVPLEQQFQLAGLTIEGTFGVWFGGVLTALIPAPHGPIYDPVNLPLYLAVLPAITLTAAALTRPLVTLISRRLFAVRSWAYDQRRTRRQSYLVGLLAAALVVLGGLRLLSWLNMLLLLLVILLIELVFLALIRTGDSA